MILEHEAVASQLVEYYLKSDLAQNHWTLFSKAGHTVNIMKDLKLSTDRQLDIIQDALTDFAQEDIVFLVEDIAPVLRSKHKSIAWNLVARSVYDFFAELEQDATVKQAMKLFEEGR